MCFMYASMYAENSFTGLKSCVCHKFSIVSVIILDVSYALQSALPPTTMR